MRYFRTYPWGMQLLMFFLMVFTFLSAAGVILLSVFTKMTGFSPMQMSGITAESPMALIKAALVAQGMQNIFIFMLPALVFAYLAHPRPMEYLGLRRPGKTIQILLTLLLMFGAWPLLLLAENLMHLIDFGASVKATQEIKEETFRAFMKMDSFADFVRGFVVMAIIPAVGEELFFRGALMRFAKKKSTNMVMPILFSAAVFSLAHSSVYGSVSIFLAGVLLAVIYNLTGSLWCSIVAHMFFNGSQIVLQYLGRSNAAVKTFVEKDNVPYYYAIAGAVVFCVALYLLIKNKTTLPDNWADDFTPEEFAQLREEKRNRLL